MLTLRKARLLNPDKKAIDGSNTSIKADSTLLFESLCDGSLFSVVCWKPDAKIRALIDSVHQPPNTPAHFSMRDPMHKRNVIRPATSKVTKSNT